MKSRRMQRMLSLLLVCVMVLSMIPAVSAAEPNLCTGATVTASSYLNGHPTLGGLSSVVDGSYDTGWTSDPDTHVQATPAWIQLELTEAVTMNTVSLMPRLGHDNISNSETVLGFPVDFTIQVSTDGANWNTVVTETDYPTPAHELQTFTFDAVSNVKFLKVDITKQGYEGNASSYRAQLMEIEARYDENAAAPVEPIPVDLSGAVVTVSSSIAGNGTWAPKNAIDGNTGLGWSSDGPRSTDVYNEWIQLELPEATSLSEVTLVPRYDHGNTGVDQFLCFPKDFTIQVSADGETWETVVSKTGYTATKQSGEVFAFADKVNVKFIKIDATKLSHEGNTTLSYRFQLMEIKAAYVPHTVKELISAISGVAVDYENECIVLPELSGLTGEIVSSSNPDVVALDGSVDVVNGGTAEVVLKYTNEEGESAETKAITVTVVGLLEKMTVYVPFVAAAASSDHINWPSSHLTNGSISNGFWSNGDDAPDVVEIVGTLEEPTAICGMMLYPRISPADGSGKTMFPETFEIQVSSDKETWTSVYKTEAYGSNNSKDPQKITFDAQADVQYVKIIINRNGSYVQLAEIEAVGVSEVVTAAEAAEAITVEQNDKKLQIGNVTEQFRVTVTAAEPAGIVGADRVITLPETDTEVDVTILLTNRFNEEDTASVTRKVLVKSQATMDVEAATAKVTLIPCPANDADQITLPSLDGYTITIAESDHPDVVSVDGKITRSDDTTYGVRLTLKVTSDKTGASALTKPLLVPIYKTYVAPTMTQGEIDAIKAEYESKAYGLFVHYISNYDAWGGCVYTDGTSVQTVDELAGAFDAAAFAKAAHELGVEYVVLTMWHGDTRTLFPSMTNQRWRDDRRAEGSKSKKTYSDRDVVMDLLDELDQYGIDLHLYTHPTDGHDFTAEDQVLTGAGDASGSYAVWNQYINELYYEVCERYGTRIKGLWFDGVFGRTSGAANQARLRATCLSFNPAMILTMNTGFTEGNLNPAPGYTTPDYRSWEVNRYVDYVNDMRFSRYQAAIVVAAQGWWTTKGKDASYPVQSSEDMFQYLVAMSSVSSHGGFLTSTGFYPVREGEVLDDYFMPGIYDALKGVADYLSAVEESIKNTDHSTAYPTTENLTVSQLEWGVANESTDDKYVYLHVLNAPEGDTLNLPETADGTILSKNAVILNFDGTQTPVTIEKTDSGYAIELPEGTEWSEVDTVIKAKRATDVVLKVTGEAKSTIDAEELSYTVSVEDADKLATVTLVMDIANLTDIEVKPVGDNYLLLDERTDGTVTLIVCNNAGITGTADLVTITGKPVDIGNASVTVTKAVLSGYEGEGETYMDVSLDAASAVTYVDYGTYDVNHDRVVNMLDITRAQRWYGTADPICDVNDDGIVDVEDMILILNNYTK